MLFNKSKKIAKRLKDGEEGHLSDLQLNQKAVVLALHNDNPALRRRLLDMGITKGVVVQIKKIAPLGDPVDIELRGYELCLRRADMRQIDIKVIEDENSFSRQSK
jgi:ferrous iron transport protein A